MAKGAQGGKIQVDIYRNFLQYWLIFPSIFVLSNIVEHCLINHLALGFGSSWQYRRYHHCQYSFCACRSGIWSPAVHFGQVWIPNDAIYPAYYHSATFLFRYYSFRFYDRLGVIYWESAPTLLCWARLIKNCSERYQHCLSWKWPTCPFLVSSHFNNFEYCWTKTLPQGIIEKKRMR